MKRFPGSVLLMITLLFGMQLSMPLGAQQIGTQQFPSRPIRMMVPAAAAGVTDIAVHGGRSRELTITLDPDALSARSISTEDVIRSIRSNNAYARVGTLESASAQTQIVVDGDISTADTLSKIAIGGTPENPIYVSDVATVQAGHDTLEHDARIATKEGAGAIARPNVVYLSFAKAKGTNITAVTEAAREIGCADIQWESA